MDNSNANAKLSGSPGSAAAVLPLYKPVLKKMVNSSKAPMAKTFSLPKFLRPKAIQSMIKRPKSRHQSVCPVPNRVLAASPPS